MTDYLAYKENPILQWNWNETRKQYNLFCPLINSCTKILKRKKTGKSIASALDVDSMSCVLIEEPNYASLNLFGVDE